MDDTQADRDAILAAAERYRLAVLSKSADAALHNWADDMIWMRSNEPEVHGIEACRKAYQASSSHLEILEYRMSTKELVVSGDWAFHRIRVENLVRIRGAEPPIWWDSKSLIIWRRQSDGAWKFARAINNPNTSEGRPGYGRYEQDEP